ncbi:MAG: 4a-hydroxytetrahydrobiopterin dehydratase [Phycisphaeraceae bacterium]|nr:MAG: 4a-hydroxytetrahydrobiopterin dehydratase [Phycisphaeraceae bacterium]
MSETGVEKMSEREIEAALASAPDWNEVGGELQRTFQFDGFAQSMAFVNRVAEAAEASQHHPDILIRYNKVTLTLSTHDAGGITARDFDLAGVINAFV